MAPASMERRFSRIFRSGWSGGRLRMAASARCKSRERAWHKSCLIGARRKRLNKRVLEHEPKFHRGEPIHAGVDWLVGLPYTLRAKRLRHGAICAPKSLSDSPGTKQCL